MLLTFHRPFSVLHPLLFHLVPPCPAYHSLGRKTHPMHFSLGPDQQSTLILNKIPWNFILQAPGFVDGLDNLPAHLQVGSRHTRVR